MTFRTLFSVGMLSLLSACVSQPPVLENTAEFVFRTPDDMSTWAANGKFSFRSPDNRESGQFYWNQNGDDYLLRLVGPFGMGTAEVENKSGNLTVRSRGETYQGDITDQLLLELTGISVPLNQLSNILVGGGQLTQSAWQVEYQAAMMVDDYLFPERLTLTSGDQVLQIFVSRWSI